MAKTKTVFKSTCAGGCTEIRWNTLKSSRQPEHLGAWRNQAITDAAEHHAPRSAGSTHAGDGRPLNQLNLLQHAL
jgi:hypothetical protein